MIYRTMTAEEQSDTELVSRRLQPHRVAIPDIDLLAGLQPNWPSRPERGHRAGNLHYGVETSPAFARAGQTASLALRHRPKQDSQKPSPGRT